MNEEISLEEFVDDRFDEIIDIMLTSHSQYLCECIPPDDFINIYADNLYYQNDLIKDLIKIRLKVDDKEKVMLDIIRMIKGIRTN